MSNDHIEFLESEFLQLTVRAALQHSGTYVASAAAQAKEAFRHDLKQELRMLVSDYGKVVAGGTHIERLVGMASTLGKRYKRILRDGRLRIGITQKAVNLYLKYLWCAGMAARPPHCPFDYTVIRHLRSASGYDGPDWTRLTSRDEYESLVSSALEAAGKVPLAEWELRYFNRNRP